RRQIRRKLDVGAFERNSEVPDALLADVAGFLAERRKRAGGIAGAPEERSEKLAVGQELHDLELDDSPDPVAEVLHPGQRPAERRVELIVRLPVEGHDDGLLRREVVVRRSGRDAGPRGDLPHGRFGEPSFLEEIEGRAKNSPPRLFGLWRRVDARSSGRPHQPLTRAAAAAGSTPAPGEGLGGRMDCGAMGGGEWRISARRRSREKTYRLKKCMTPRASSTRPSLVLSISREEDALTGRTGSFRARGM